MLLTEETLRQQYLQHKKELHWETDLELHSKFLDRKVLLFTCYHFKPRGVKWLQFKVFRTILV